MERNFLYVGTFPRAYRTDAVDSAFGIYSFSRQVDIANLEPLGMVATPRPGWITAHPSRRVLYAVNEVANFEHGSGGGVSAFGVDRATGALTPLNSRPTTALPCHCQVDASGRFLLVATFGGGSVHLFPLEADGRIGVEADAHRHSGSSVHPRRQLGPHAHSVCIDPGNRFVLVPDLGMDQVVVYELDRAHGRLVPRPERTLMLPPGSGPRHLTFDREGRFAYLMNEMSATLGVLAYDGTTGGLHWVESVDLLPVGFAGLRSGAAVNLHPAGRFVYATTRSHTTSGEPPVRGLDALHWFEIETVSGRLQRRGSVPTGGEIARDFTFDPDGKHLLVAHQGNASIVTFCVDPDTGTPARRGDAVRTPVPVCLRFL